MTDQQASKHHTLHIALLALLALCALGAVPSAAFAAPPAATTKAAIAVSYEQATLKGAVNPEG
ncbi:MAG: hypothetical protein ACTHK3_07850, partial [Solirubrobacterales bacterium]